MWNRSISWLSEEIYPACTRHIYIYIYTQTHIHTHTYIYICIYMYTHTRVHILRMENEHLRSFSRPVSSFVTLPSPFSDFLSSVKINLSSRSAKSRHGRTRGESGKKKNTEKKESESFSRILNASNVIHGQLSLAREEEAFFREQDIQLWKKKKKSVSSVIHTKYILYICATIEIYIYAKQWEPIDRLAGVVRVSPARSSETLFESCECNFVRICNLPSLTLFFLFKLYLKLYLFKVYSNRADFTYRRSIHKFGFFICSILNVHAHFLTVSRAIGDHR